MSGASGGPPYAEQYAAWADDLSRMLRERMKLASRPTSWCWRRSADGTTAATAANVRARCSARSGAQMTPRDLLFIVLIGHGTFDGADAKFNLVGPDLEVGRLGVAVRRLARPAGGRQHRVGRLSVPRAAGGSAPRRHLRDRQRRAALRHGLPRVLHPRVRGRRRRHRQERPGLDLGGVRGSDGVGAALLPAPGPAGDRARAARRQRRRGRPRVGRIERRRDGGELDVPGRARRPARRRPTTCWCSCCSAARRWRAKFEELRIRKQFLPPPEYQQEFERIMLALAKVQREIRDRRGSL